MIKLVAGNLNEGILDATSEIIIYIQLLKVRTIYFAMGLFGGGILVLFCFISRML